MTNAVLLLLLCAVAAFAAPGRYRTAYIINDRSIDISRLRPHVIQSIENTPYSSGNTPITILEMVAVGNDGIEVEEETIVTEEELVEPEVEVTVAEAEVQAEEEAVAEEAAVEEAAVEEVAVEEVVAEELVQDEGEGDGECGPGESRRADGVCVVPDVNRNVFLYNAPLSNLEDDDTDLDVPNPSVNLNMIFVRIPKTSRARKPLVVAPPKQKTNVYLLQENEELEPREVIQLEDNNESPGVFFINYDQGDNPDLPGGIDLQTALSNSVSLGEIINGEESVADAAPEVDIRINAAEAVSEAVVEEVEAEASVPEVEVEVTVEAVEPEAVEAVEAEVVAQEQEETAVEEIVEEVVAEAEPEAVIEAESVPEVIEEIVEEVTEDASDDTSTRILTSSDSRGSDESYNSDDSGAEIIFLQPTSLLQEEQNSMSYDNSGVTFAFETPSVNNYQQRYQEDGFEIQPADPTTLEDFARSFGIGNQLDSSYSGSAARIQVSEDSSSDGQSDDDGAEIVRATVSELQPQYTDAQLDGRAEEQISENAIVEAIAQEIIPQEQNQIIAGENIRAAVSEIIVPAVKSEGSIVVGTGGRGKSLSGPPSSHIDMSEIIRAVPISFNTIKGSAPAIQQNEVVEAIQEVIGSDDDNTGLGDDTPLAVTSNEGFSDGVAITRASTLGKAKGISIKGGRSRVISGGKSRSNSIAPAQLSGANSFRNFGRTQTINPTRVASNSGRSVAFRSQGNSQRLVSPSTTRFRNLRPTINATPARILGRTRLGPNFVSPIRTGFPQRINSFGGIRSNTAGFARNFPAVNSRLRTSVASFGGNRQRNQFTIRPKPQAG